MPQVWYPGAVQNPGANAGYKAGRTSMVDCVCHETIGVDSTAIGLNGYFHWLVSRDGRIQQFAEVDATTWHVGEDNAYGPGIEVEYLPGTDDAVFTLASRQACSALIHWLSAEWGIPLTYHDALHDTQPGSFHGFVSHRSIIQTEEHQDFWPQSDWDLMVAAPTPPTPPTLESEEDTQMITQTFGPDGNLYVTVVGQAGNVFVTKIHPDKVPDQGSPKTVENYAELTGFVGCPTPTGWK